MGSCMMFHEINIIVMQMRICYILFINKKTLEVMALA